MISHLFVYGTLLRELEHHHHLIASGAVFEGNASIAGRLYVCEFPALVHADDSRVFGELYSFADLGAALPVLDELELEGTMYHRVAVRARRTSDGRTSEAYAYRYAVSVRSCRHVPSGDYRVYLAESSAQGSPNA